MPIGVWLTLSLLLLSGCVSTGLTERVPVEELVRARTGVALPVTPTAAVAADVETLLREPVTVDGAVRIALLNNRSLRATLLELGVSESELAQARLLHNPVLAADVRFPHKPLEIELTQDVVDLLVRPLRTRVAASRFRAAQLRVAHEALELTAAVRAAFYEVQGSVEMHTMRATVAHAGELAAELADRQFRAGNISQLDLDNTLAMSDEARLALAASDANVDAALEALARLLGSQATAIDRSAIESLPDPIELATDVAHLENTAVAQRLDMAATAEDILAAAGALPIARYAQFPTLALGVRVERDGDGTHGTGPAIEVSLPLFDRGRAARAGVRAELDARTESSAALEMMIRSEVRASLAQLNSARDRATYFRDVILPRRSRIVSETQREYNYMLVGVYQLLQAKQDEIEAIHDHIDARRSYWVAHAELERAAGGDLTPTPSP